MFITAGDLFDLTFDLVLEFGPPLMLKRIEPQLTIVILAAHKKSTHIIYEPGMVTTGIYLA